MNMVERNRERSHEKKRGGGVPEEGNWRKRERDWQSDRQT